MRVKFFLSTGLFLVFFVNLWGISFPNVSLFPVKLNYSFSLLSDKGNRIDFFETIQISEDIESGVWLLWRCSFSINGKKDDYTLTLWVNYDGEIYLYSLKDRFYERVFDDIPLVFSSSIEVNKPIILGENISLTYTGGYGSFVHPKTKIRLENVIKATLKIASEHYILYFVKGKGLQIIETPEEVFVKQ
ncbi:MAG: hypothetical protein ACP5QT_06440 [Brevinematia bacterium]